MFIAFIGEPTSLFANGPVLVLASNARILFFLVSFFQRPSVRRRETVEKVTQQRVAKAARIRILVRSASAGCLTSLCPILTAILLLCCAICALYCVP